MPTLDFTANTTYPNPNEIVELTTSASFPSTGYAFLWLFYNNDHIQIFPSSSNGVYTTRDISVSFANMGNVNVILYARDINTPPSTPPPGIYPPPETDGGYTKIKFDYIVVTGQSANHIYSIVRNDLNLVTLTTTGYKPISYKITQLDANTLQETTITDYTSITTATDTEISMSTDGVYFLYVKYGTTTIIECKYILVNILDVKTYLETQSLETLTCTPTNDNIYPAFANKDYIYNVISNLAMTFLGVEFDDIAFNYGTFGEDIELIQGKEYTPITIGTSTPNWLNQDSVCCLQRKDGYNFDFNSQLEIGKIYQCIATGTPTSYGGTTISAYTSDVNTYLQNIAGSLYRITQYLTS